MFVEINQYVLKMLKCGLECSNLMHRDLVVTSANDGKHMATSFHYKNRALDFRTKDMTEVEKQRFVTNMESLLGPNYQVILENNPVHAHIEYDPR